jgi:Protein of unknown function (DUF3450)
MKTDWIKPAIALIAFSPILALAQDAPPDVPPDPEAAAQEYAMLLRDTFGLEQRNALVSRQIRAQEAKLSALQTTMEQVPELEEQLPPLLIRMVDALDQFVKLDLPFLTEERADRVANLYLLIEDNVSNVQKLRRILEAWNIEIQYGQVPHTETGMVPLPDGTERNADFVVLGRIALLFQTADDEAITGTWDQANQRWVILGSEHRNPVRQAIRMGRSQVAPDLVLLPVPAPAP